MSQASNNSDVKVRIRNLSKIYPNGDGVKNIDLDIREGEIVTLLGPSGCGKTTILRALGGFLDLTEGSILINNEDVSTLPPEDRPTGMVFQSYNLWPHMTVEENLAFGMKLRKIPKKEIKEDIKDILEMMKMPGTENKYPSQLSGGQQQRIAIGRSLLLKPAVLLMDEPFSALDAKIRMQMREELKRIQSELNITVVFVTHDQEEAMSLAHRIVVMDKGKMAQVGTPTEIYEEPSSTYVASFIGEMNFLQEKDGSHIAFRPEDVNMTADESGQYTGRIQSIMLLGHYASIGIQLDTQINNNSTDHLIRAYVSRNEISHLHENQQIYFNLNKEIIYEKGA